MTASQTTYQRIAWGVSIVIHVLVLLLFCFIGFQERDPPLEEIGMPLTIRLGFDDAGEGDTFDEASAQTSTEIAATPVETTPPNFATQDVKPTVAVKKDEKKTEKTEVKPQQELVQTPEEPKVDAHLNHLINKFKTNKNTGNGTQNGGGNDGVAGAQGRPDGSITGGDIGGSFPGGGGSFRLKGRNILFVPKIEDKSQDEGVVVVEILVDRKGNVIKATPGAKGTTASSSILFKKAQEAAYKAKFTPNPDVAEEQIGTMTFIFKLGF